MSSKQCNVEFGYQFNICSGTEENHRSGYELTSRQQSDMKYANPNVSPHLAVGLFEKKKLNILMLCILLYIDNS
jgi:hypothetical protein